MKGGASGHDAAAAGLHGEPRAADANLWVDPDWARRYLAERDTIPHRAEGVAVLVECLPRAPRRVLDLGTGDGFLMGVVRAARPGVSGIVCDFSEEMLERARTRFGAAPEIDVVEHDLNAPLPSEWGTFDLVVSSLAIHHLVDARKQALAREVFAVLDPGGVFLNLEHVASPSPELHDEFLAVLGKTRETEDPSNRLAPVEAQLGWLRNAGFRHVDCHWKWLELALLGGRKPA